MGVSSKTVAAVLLLAAEAGLSLVARADAAPIRLVPDRTEVVIAADAPKVTRFAAKELATFLGKTLGSEVGIVSEPTDGDVQIVLESDGGKLPRDGFRIRTVDGKVYIAGADDPSADIEAVMAQRGKGNMKFERATVFGVYEFLERFAGVRFYFPGELGTVVQPKPEIVVPETDITSSPYFTVRHYYQRGDGDWPAEAEGEYAPGSAEELNWVRTRMQTRRLAACHGQNGFRITERFHETHPEYLQLRKDGTREDRLPDKATLFSSQGWRYLHLCQSEVWDQLFLDAKEYLSNGKRIPKDLDPEAFAGYYIDVMPQDGFKECFCDKCQKAYDKSVRDYASELVWSQTAAFARRLKDEGYGDMLVTQNAYYPYGAVPKCDIPDNVRVMVAKNGPFLVRQPGHVERQVAEVKAWSDKMGGGRCVWIWTYPGKYGALNIPLLPQMAPRAYADYYGRMAKFVFGAFAESESDKAIYNYLNYYVFGKVAWNGRVDVRALLDEHHQLMFGAAAPEMKAFYDGLERKFLGEVMGREDGITMGPIGPIPNPPSELVMWTQVYDERTISEWERLFASAAKKVPSGSIEARRIAFVKREFLDGLAKKSREMNLGYSVAGELERRRTAKPANLVANGDFSSLDGWTASTNGIVAIDRDVCVSKGGSLRIQATDVSVEGPFLRAFAKRMLDKGAEKMKPDTKYRISCFVKCENVKGLKRDAGVSLCWHDNVDRALPVKFLTGTTDWVHLSVEFQSRKNTNIATMAFVQPRITNATGTAWFDDILIEEVK